MIVKAELSLPTHCRPDSVLYDAGSPIPFRSDRPGPNTCPLTTIIVTTEAAFAAEDLQAWTHLNSISPEQGIGGSG